MSRAAPTPGPWRAQAGLVVADAPVPRVIAQTYSPASLARWPDDPAERDANARLIAAAPEMAEAIAHIVTLARSAMLHQNDLDKTGFVQLAEETLAVAQARWRRRPSDDAL
ncbi:hypothetical protein [Elioraea sp.]|uniref:hypothetical protein n=1 Tax=Elioraea sp. TaxID=2185103 RepID=UPI0021DBEC0F|nr:hypothetical protein [Elioraea sp.]GIX10356.1 MAG: hypothetical protein KatS3mg116_2066 [Elioraea sp.]